MTPAQRAAADAHLAACDAVMAGLVARYGPCGLLKRRRPVFTVLASAIIGQQVSNKAAEALQRRVEALAGGALTPGALAVLTPEALRAAGLSTAKARWLVDLARRMVAGTRRPCARSMPFRALAPGRPRWC
jgi:DNA-3-methyladenine glycosylase II